MTDDQTTRTSAAPNDAGPGEDLAALGGEVLDLDTDDASDEEETDDELGSDAEEPDAVDLDDLDFAPLLPDSSERERGLFTLYPTAEEKNTRLDKYISGHLSSLSRSYVQQLIAEENVTVDGRIRQRTFKVTPGQVIELLVPPPVDDVMVPEDLPIDIVYEDVDLLVVNKRPGMVVHPAPGHATGTLANAILFHVPEVVMAGSHRPGIVHRLDKDTSGLIVVAKTERGRVALLRQWADRSVEKRYLALAHGSRAEDEATVDAPIARDPAQRNRMAIVATGREARSHVRVKERLGEATFVEVAIETGRTHQIRVHLAFIGNPVVGDAVYNRFKGRAGGTKSIAVRQMLHAAQLTFDTPDGKRLELVAPLPGDMTQVLDAFRTKT